MYRLIFLLAAIVSVSCRNVNNRIVGGETTSIQKYPYQVSLANFFGQYSCGAAILNNHHVITASHCAFWEDPSDVQVRVGTALRNFGGVVHNVEEVFIHPNFTLSSLDYDVSIIKLKEPIKFSAYVAPISLVPANERPQVGEIVTSTGWGRTSYGTGNELADALQVVRVLVVDKDSCKLAHKKQRYQVTDRMFCAGGELDKGSYRGDSGGPLVNERKQLVGIVSWGTAGNITGIPSVYTDVTNHQVREFIDKHADE